jgi:hypothetical protein
MTDDRVVPANRASSRQEVQWDHPRVDIVFRFWQSDNENHDWREGPPRTLLLSSIGWLAFALPVRQCRTKKEYCFLTTSIRPQTARLAGIYINIGSYTSHGG